MSKSKNAVVELEAKNSGNGNDQEKIQAVSIEEVKKALDAQIEMFNRKSELILNRERFLVTKNELKQYLAEQGTDFDESLDSPSLKVQLMDNRKYRGDHQISIANNLIVREFIDFAIRKIDAKVLEIEKEILG